MDMMFWYRILTVVVGIGCAWEVLTARKWTDQVTAAVVLIPLALRALLIK